MRVSLYFSVILRLCIALKYRTNEVTLQKTVGNISNCTVFERSFEKVLTRKKRWFVFPKGSSVVLTLVVTKTIVGGSPRGLQESIELDNPYSLPPWIEGWKPITVLFEKENKSVPSTKINKAKSKFDTVHPKNSWNYNHYKNFHGLGNSVQSPLVFSKSSTGYREKNTYPWHIHREYRERRAIYEKLESLGQFIKVHIRSCIKRAICELKQELMPEGVSFIQDVARILFTTPTDHEFKDEYFDDADDRHTSCARKFSVTCPISPASYFLPRRPTP